MNKDKSSSLNLLFITIILGLWLGSSLSFSVSVKAEESVLDTEPKEIKLIFPESLATYTVQLKDEFGLMVDKKELDEEGRVLFKVPKKSKVISLTFLENSVSNKEGKKTNLSPVTVVSSFLITMIIIALVSFFVGRISNRRILRALRDYIYDEELD